MRVLIPGRWLQRHTGNNPKAHIYPDVRISHIKIDRLSICGRSVILPGVSYQSPVNDLSKCPYCEAAITTQYDMETIKAIDPATRESADG